MSFKKTGRHGKTPGASNTEVIAPSSRKWDFVWNNYDENSVDILLNFFSKTKDIKYLFQFEVGSENETPHIQGCFTCKSPKKKSTLIKIDDHFSCRPARNWLALVQYCCKDDTREANTEPHSNWDYKEWILKSKGGGRKRRDVRDVYLEFEPYPWQSKLVKELSIECNDNRRIIWYYDEEGNSGKSIVAKHLRLTRPKDVLYMGGKAADCKFAITKWYDTDPENDLFVVIFNFARTLEGKVSYTAIEEIKDGIWFSGKYESCNKEHNTPHIVIFANWEPDYKAMSRDRWEIRVIDVNKDYHIIN